MCSWEEPREDKWNNICMSQLQIILRKANILILMQNTPL